MWKIRNGQQVEEPANEIEMAHVPYEEEQERILF